jgi:hypothetical protein
MFILQYIDAMESAVRDNKLNGRDPKADGAVALGII